MKILSLFDWISCGYLALERAWIPIDKYYASEIDTYAIEIAKANHPDIEEIWDVCNIRWEDYKDIDLIMWGSPCQNLSGIGNGKGLEWEKSKLFFEFVRLVKEIRPKFFLLENVKMKKEWMERMSEELFWIPAVLINSSLLSAQNRPRLYWVWVRDWDTYKQVEFPMPEDKGITIKDILDKEVDDKYYLSQDQIDRILHWKSYQNPLDKVLTWGSKCPTLTARGAGEWHSGMILLTDEGKEIELPCATQLGNGYWYPNAFWNNKAYCLRAVQPNGVILWDKAIRKLTPTECEKLQTVPLWYTDVNNMKDRQRYKVLGNWWTVDVIAYIFSHLPIDNA